ncbi:hypothetical protein [Nostoc sp. 'Peltigera membranacea cyanobiont' N6]|uniref:hypothetical protein n=1 Tax=Nostoc sp. 'Peltigera membranacea cyanobiont' N6 TaxID=1261031 RepID=UPI000CF3583C|nr:hypothetical protein [Nostoc sp. 'Peltigera membranacea cyanobiont' N6]
MLLVYPLNNENLYFFIYRMLTWRQYNISPIQKSKISQVSTVSFDRVNLNNYSLSQPLEVGLRGEMRSDTESYAKELMSCFQYCDGVPARRRRSSGIKLYQLKSLKFSSLKALLYRIKLLHQIAYRLIGTLRIAKNID